MSQSPSRTTEDSSIKLLRKPILIAGLLGGFLGGFLSIVGTRFIKPAVSVPLPTAKEIATEEARQVVEAFLDILKAGKYDEFMEQAKRGYNYIPESFAESKRNFDNSRIAYKGIFGPSLQQFDLLSQTAASPSLIQFLYLEKFEHGAVVWKFIMYRAKDNWRISYLNWYHDTFKAFEPEFGP
ncbi:MAG TPA: hypothetical protein VG097_07220 [Gemmata sp.]|jgi:hypothetical protein|nr:hypothetical protein [Gemmata sp.]